MPSPTDIYVSTYVLIFGSGLEHIFQHLCLFTCLQVGAKPVISSKDRER